MLKFLKQKYAGWDKYFSLSLISSQEEYFWLKSEKTARYNPTKLLSQVLSIKMSTEDKCKDKDDKVTMHRYRDNAKFYPDFYMLFYTRNHILHKIWNINIS